MPPPLKIESEADFTKLVQEAEKAINSIKRIADAQALSDKSATKLDKNLNVLGGTFTKSASAGKTLTATLKKTELGMEVLGFKVVDTTAKIKEQEEALKKAAESQRRFKREASNADKSINRGFGFDQAQNLGASRQEFFNLQNERGKLKELIAANELTSKQVLALWQQVETGRVTAATGANRRIIQQLLRVKKAQEDLGASARKASDKATEAARKAAQALAKQGNAALRIKNINEESAKSADKILLTWKSIVRLLSVQIVYRGVFALRQQLFQAAQAAVDLQIKIAEIQTINTARNDYEDWADTLRDLSDAFGLDVIDEAEAAYQSLSNQVVNSTDEYRQFGRVTSELATAAVGTNADAVNLLTGQLNAFGKDTSEARDLAAKFFKTIELGRLRLSEVANSMGRVSVFASQLGFSVEELDALLSAITIRGINASEAMTQIRGVFISLLKPTNEMASLFEKLGVTSGEMGVQVFGGLQFLQRLFKEVNNTSTGIAGLVPRVRGMTGALGLASDEFASVFDILEQINNDSLPDFDRAIQTVLNNTGKEFEIATNKIRNFFIENLDEGLQSLSDFTDGFEDLVTSVKLLVNILEKFLVPTLIVATAAMVRFTAAVAVKSLGKNPYILVLVGLASLIELLKLANKAQEEYNESIANQIKASEFAINRTSVLISEQIQKTINNIEKLLKLESSSVVQSASILQGAFSQAVKANIEDFELLEDVVKETNKEILKSFKETAKETEKAFDVATKAVEKQRDAIRDLVNLIGSTTFEFSLEGEDPVKQVQLISDRIKELQRLRDTAATSGDTQSFEELADQVRELQARRKELVDTIREEAIESRKNAIEKKKELEIEREAFRRDSQKKQESVSRIKDPEKRRRAERDFAEELVKIRSKDSEFAVKIAEQEQLILEAKRQQGLVPDRPGAQSPVLADLNEEKRLREELLKFQEAEEKRLHALRIQQIQDEEALRFRVREVEGFNIGDVLSLDDPKAIEDAITRQIDAIRALQDARDRLIGSTSGGLDSDLFNKEQGIREAEVNRLAELELSAARELAEEKFKNVQNELSLRKQEAEASQALINEANRALQRNIIRLRGTITEEEVRVFTPEGGTEIGSQEVINDLSSIGKILEEAGLENVDLIKNLVTTLENVGTADAAQQQQIINQLQAFINQVQTSVIPAVRGNTREFSFDNISNAENIVTAFTDLQSLLNILREQLDSGNLISKLQQNVQDQQAEINNLEAELSNQLSELKNISNTEKNSAELMNDSAKTLAEAVQEFKNAVTKLSQTAGRLGQGRLHGGTIHGATLGRDHIPLLADGGEFVVNAAQTRKFKPILEAINSGRFKNFGFQDGGQVPSFGDVVVNESSSPQITARAVVDEINRGLRQGTLRFYRN